MASDRYPRVNTQNRVRAYDFVRTNGANRTANKFREMKVFYERKPESAGVRNEPRYRGFRRLSLANWV